MYRPTAPTAAASASVTFSPLTIAPAERGSGAASAAAEPSSARRSIRRDAGERIAHDASTKKTCIVFSERSSFETAWPEAGSGLGEKPTIARIFGFRTQRYGGRVVALSHNVRVSLWPPSPRCLPVVGTRLIRL
eukprot:5419804-Prymnesium_polylepis.2